VGEEKFKHSSKTITWMLANRSWLKPRTHLMIPNVSWGLLHWEADLVAISKAGYLIEIEIKISNKTKFKSRIGWQMVKQFYYAIPAGLTAHFPQDYLSRAGLIEVPDTMDGYCRVVHEAPVNRDARALTATEISQALRLLGLRFWAQFKGRSQ
jgi:hypothetical protein